MYANCLVEDNPLIMQALAYFPKKNIIATRSANATWKIVILQYQDELYWGQRNLHDIAFDNAESFKGFVGWGGVVMWHPVLI